MITMMTSTVSRVGIFFLFFLYYFIHSDLLQTENLQVLLEVQEPKANFPLTINLD